MSTILQTIQLYATPRILARTPSSDTDVSSSYKNLFIYFLRRETISCGIMDGLKV